MIVLGINAIGHHDASACLVRDGELVAFVEEERLTRLKHAVGQRPINAVRWCLNSQGISWNDVDVVTTPWVEEEHGIIAPPGYNVDLSFGHRELGRDVARWPAGLAALLAETGGSSESAPILVQVSHHLAHAASAYWCSGMDDSTIVVVDGEGDRVSTSIAHGRDGQIELVRQFSTVDSLGQFYACMTQFLGLGDFGEGKLMGLAPYGSATVDFPEIVLEGGGGYRVDLPGEVPRYDPKQGDWQAIIAGWMKVLGDRFGDVRPVRDRRAPSLLNEWARHDRDLAASAQAALESTLSHVARGAIAATGSPNLVLAGGVALNCAMNGKLAGLPEVEELFVQPIAGDNGAPVGAALHCSALLGDRPMRRWNGVGFGPTFNAAQCAAAINEAELKFTEPGDISESAAGHIANGRIVCWFQGSVEGGPRALGHRSIVASPGSEHIRDKVNDVKRRSRWRPLAPSVCEEDRDVFSAGRLSPFMIIADTVRPQWRGELVGITHTDSTARPHTVNRDVDPLYWRLIDHHKRFTGHPAVINTSLNGEDEPIVCAPDEAIRTFLRGGADVLCLGPFEIRHPTRIRR